MLTNDHLQLQLHDLEGKAARLREALAGANDLPPLALAGGVVELDKFGEKLAKLFAKLQALAVPREGSPAADAGPSGVVPLRKSAGEG